MSKIKEKAQKEFSSRDQAEENKVEVVFDKKSRKYVEK